MCRLSNDGSYFLITFDIETDRGMFGRTHPCVKTFDFSGVANALCVWQDHMSLKVFPTGNNVQVSSAGTLIEIGDLIAVKDNILRAKCPALASTAECALWLTASDSSCALTAPLAAVSPVVSISAPTVLSHCKGYVLDLSASSGSGGRAWSRQEVNVSSLSQSNTSLTYHSEIVEFYRDDYVLAPPTALPAGKLIGDEVYAFTVTLCNFLLQCHTSTTAVAVINMNAMPIVTIAGSSARIIRRVDALSFLSSAYIGTCNSTNRYSGMTFLWQVAEDGVLNEQLASTSKNPFQFILPGSVLNAGSIYTITVSVVDTMFGGESYSSVTVEVGPSPVVAAVTGGEYQSWRVGGATLTLDASNSYDMDTGEGTALSYEWSCIQNQSSASLGASFCAQLFLTPLLEASELTLDMSFMDFSGFVGATFAIGLRIEGSYNRSASTKVLVTVDESTSPKITLLSFPSKINAQAPVQILTSVEVTAPATGVWSSSDINIDLSAISLIPSLSTSFPSRGVYSFNLAIGGSSLDAGSEYDFILTVGAGQDVSATRVTVKVVEPPRSGEFIVSPLTGFEFQDSFQFSTKRWTDDEIPLSYSFGYFSTSDERMNVLQGRGEASFLFDKYLPRGAKARNYNLTCGMYAFNALDAWSTRTLDVKVSAVQVSAEDFETIVISQLSAVSEHQDINAVKSIVSVGVSILNSANCSLAPSACGSSLGREECSDTPHTCGPCLEGFIGESSGDGNSACYTIAEEPSSEDVSTPLLNGTCVDSRDCNAMQKCEAGLCFYATKSCPSDCSGKGSCQLELKTSGAEVDACLINDFTCQASCICEEGYLGSGCFETRSSMQAKQQTRYQLISKFNSTLKNEDTSIYSLSAQIGLVMDLGSNPSELTDASCVVLQHIIASILTSVTEVEIPITTLEGLLGVLDNCDQMYVDGAGDNNVRVADDHSSTALDNNKLLRSSFNGLVSRSMIVGEIDKEFIDTYSRSTVSKHRMGDSSEQAVPQTHLEKVFSNRKSLLRMDGQSASDAAAFTRSVFLEESEAKMYANASQFSSNPLKVQYFVSSATAQDMPANTTRQNVIMVLQNTAPQAYITNDSSAGDGDNSSSRVTQFVTHCASVNATAAASSTTNYTCPDGQVVSHSCTGGSRNVITSTCPALRYIPVCRILSSSNEDSKAPSCSVVAFTSTNVTCNCTIYLEESSTSSIGNGRRQLYSSSAVESSGYIEMTSMSEHTYEGFISTNSEITDVSLGDIRKGMIVIIMFVSMWGFGAIGIFELFWSSRFRSKVMPKSAVSDLKRSSATSELSLEAKKDYLLKYIDGILPAIYRSNVEHDSTLQSMWKTIRTYHPYAVIFTAEGPGAKELKIRTGIYLLTIQSMLMFIMAVFFDLQVIHYSSCMSQRIMLIRHFCVLCD